jgi:hypothetical protein
MTTADAMIQMAILTESEIMKMKKEELKEVILSSGCRDQYKSVSLLILTEAIPIFDDSLALENIPV